MKKFIFTMILTISMLSSVIVFAETYEKDEEIQIVKESDEMTSELKLYTSHFIEGGSTLSQICESIYTSDEYENRDHWESIEEYQEEVIRINGLVNPDIIHAGKFITLPYYN